MKKPRLKYPGDQAVIKGFRDALGKVCEKHQITIEEAEEQALKQVNEPSNVRDYRVTARALGIVLKTARNAQNISLRQLSRTTHLSIECLTALENGGGDLGLTEFVRIAYALGMKGRVFAERIEEQEKKLRQQ